MQYTVIQGTGRHDFESLASAKQFVEEYYPEFALTNDDSDCINGYRCRYLWNGYFEGAELFIVNAL